ncbi:MAG: hypothetical protein GX751_11485 [Desulfuromonadaceae bacterium]|nr:hypothetical protein [Desulfuromonadaceae bacterium]
MKRLNSISLILAAAALLALSTPVPAFAQRMGMGSMHRMDGMDRMGDMMDRCLEQAEEMGLTEDQIMKIKPVHREMQKKQARFQADLKIAKIELMEIMEVKDFDLEKSSAAVKKIDQIKTAHHLEMLKDMKKIRALLTDEQFKKMKKMMFMKMDWEKPAKM